MRDFDPLFPSSAEIDRRHRAAKQLRAQYLHGLAREVRRKLLPRQRGVQVIELSLAVMLIVMGVFWTALLGSSRVTEAGTESAGVSPDQITINAPHGLPSFDDNYQRHTGVLDTLDQR